MCSIFHENFKSKSLLVWSGEGFERQKTGYDESKFGLPAMQNCHNINEKT